jgi:tripartite-type tricarboxylate transporter receptor subunit TctC
MDQLHPGTQDQRSTEHKEIGRKFKGLFARLATVLIVPLLALPMAQAQSNYPNQPIRLVVPFGAGGSADMLGRLLADRLSKTFDNPVVVENRPGATGTVGASSVVRAAPNGYTLLLVFDGTVGIAPVLRSDFPFDPVKDLAPVAKLADVNLVIAANPSVPATNIVELREYSTQNPDKLSYATPGVGSTAQMAGELLRLKAGIDWVHIPYDASGSGTFVVDVISGHVPVAIISVAVAAPFIADNKLVGIGVPSAQRNSAIPNVPTFREAGLTGYDVASWFGLAAPAGTPEDIVERLNQALKTILAEPAVIERLEGAGMTPAWSSPQAMGQLIEGDLKRWTEVAKQTEGRN